MAKLKIIPLPPQSYLRQRFHYESDTGVLRWTHQTDRSAQWDGRYAGQIAGYRLPYVTTQIRLDNVSYAAHRIIWKWMTGDDPPEEIDHRNLDRSDNRWANLRAATHKQNGRNRKVQGNSRVGVRGVCKVNGRFFARIKVDGKRFYLGCYATAYEAHAAYCKAAKKLHGEFWNPG